MANRGEREKRRLRREYLKLRETSAFSCSLRLASIFISFQFMRVRNKIKKGIESRIVPALIQFIIKCTFFGTFFFFLLLFHQQPGRYYFPDEVSFVQFSVVNAFVEIA